MVRKTLRFLWDYWYVPAFIGGVVLLWVLTGGKRIPPASTITNELEVIRAGRKAREMELQLGKEKAASNLRMEHASVIAALDEKKAKKAKELGDDPVALSHFLIRAGHSSI